MDQAAEPLSFGAEQEDPDCAVLDPHDPTLQPCARPVEDGGWAAGFGSAIPGICSSSLPLSWSLPWSADSDGAGVLVQDPAAAAFSAKLPDRRSGSWGRDQRSDHWHCSAWKGTPW
jgi:hypothetical protein